MKPKRGLREWIRKQNNIQGVPNETPSFSSQEGSGSRVDEGRYFISGGWSPTVPRTIRHLASRRYSQSDQERQTDPTPEQSVPRRHSAGEVGMYHTDWLPPPQPTEWVTGDQHREQQETVQDDYPIARPVPSPYELLCRIRLQRAGLWPSSSETDEPCAGPEPVCSPNSGRTSESD